MNYHARLKQVSHHLTKWNCDALLIEHSTNILYLTGLDLSAGKLIITKNDSHLFVDGRYIETCRARSPCPAYLIDEYPLKEWLEGQKNIKHLGFESDQTTYQSFLNLKDLIKPITLVPLSAPMQGFRLIKDNKEIEYLNQASRLGVEGYHYVLSNLREGITENEIAIELEIFWKKRGAKKTAFDPIIAFGANSSMPHHRADQTALKKGNSVLIDIGVTLQHYHSDMTRVVFFGEPPNKIKEIYSIVEEAKNLALDLCRPGTKIGELDAIVRKKISEKGYGQFFLHSLGHGIGLDIHEPPTLRSKGPYSEMTLQPGMVITIEPGIYLPNIGGVRLEDTVLITEKGHRNLTKEHF